ncbi:hypothetical protein [Desulfomonile tiedjei]|uniref:Uncharacterized protein n=1 Tax=Desulfomonile tiedjei (strain ATCC 49306 / DSM 6799 / DCB-1) TaxID=706587 RepID=I4CAS9_DESTA|nr:hypothetical protein [Desulfomonile tiedjei]AFM26670.1 hypothetical protein Desti_4030 [Desulfomonile tiedjei DSM 6799]
MYWWNMSKLEEDLREGRVNEREQFKCYLATFVAWNLAVCSGYTFSVEDLASTALNVTVIIIGTTLCYRANKKGDNADFIPRMICLGWPAGIRIAVFLASIALFLSGLSGLPAAAYGFEAYVFAMLHKLRELWSIFWGIFFLLPYYFQIHHSFIRIAQAKASDNAVEASKPILQQNGTAVGQRLKSDLIESELLKYALGILGGISITVLIVIVPIYVSDHAISKRFRILCSAWPLLISWLLVWLMRWEKTRNQSGGSPKRSPQ